MQKLLYLLMAYLMMMPIVSLSYAANDDTIGELRDKIGQDWVLIKYDRLRHIKTWIKQEDGKRFRSFKVEATLNGDLETYTRIMLDADNFGRWYWEVAKSKLIKRSSATEYYIYVQHRAPYGLPDRDVILRGVFEPQTAQNHTLILRINAVPEYLPAQANIVRMQAEDMVVKVTPVGNRKIQLEAEGYVDPAGDAPNWAINYIQRSAPYSILLGLQRMMESSKEWASNGSLPFPIYNAPL